MATEGPGRAGVPALTSLPRYEDLPRVGDGLDADQVREAFDAFRRHAAQLQAQLRVLQAAGARSGPSVEPSGHAVRMDALHLIRAAAEFADTIERDAQNASAAQLGRTEEEVRLKQTDLQAREAEVDRYRQESERQRAEMLNAARNESRELLAKSHADATAELQEAEAKGNRLLEQSRHQATELTNAARAEVEQTLEWARAQATTGSPTPSRRPRACAACSGPERSSRSCFSSRSLSPRSSWARGGRRSWPQASPAISWSWSSRCCSYATARAVRGRRSGCAPRN